MLEQLAILVVAMNKLSDARRAAIVRALCEGSGVRATARLTGSDKETVMKVLVQVGEFASVYQHHAHRGLKTKRVEADEIWAFVGAKQKNRTQPEHGDIWTFTALDSDTKLMISWLVGERSVTNAVTFMRDIRLRVTRRIQLTTDGHNMYLAAVRAAFRFDEVDYAQLVKTYGQSEEATIESARRYSPPICTGAQKVRVIGTPDPDLVSTSYVERSNLTLRMQNRRFTRLTNAFSKKAENHAHAVSLFFLYYNYCRPHQTLTQEAGGKRTTPAMASGLVERVWTAEDILTLMDPRKIVT
jgi:IS1 family transposase